LSGIGGAGNYPGGIGKLAKGKTEAVLLYEFSGPSPAGDDGESPYGNLLLLDGELYGTTWVGGANAVGSIFKRSP
jgi:hypothetical protein